MDLKLDTTSNDLAIDGGDLVLVDGLDAISQHVRLRLLTLRGEWFLDRTAGTPYLQSIFGKVASLDPVASILRDKILATPGILSFESFSLELDPRTRELSLAFQALTTGGVLDFTEVL